jgi:glyoxylase-like metal-dependent hydrolase (beta-lactamase superfamily II)
MTHPTYKLYAIKYARHERTAAENFMDGDPHDTSPMPLDYFVWAIVGDGRTLVVDTGFDRVVGDKRGRQVTRPVAEGLEALGIRHQEVRDVIITHMHYDHAGNADLFGQARFHVQDDEMQFVTSRDMCHELVNLAFEPDDIARMVHRIFAGRVQFHDGTDEIAPGITVHRLGGHTKGLQVVRVPTERGWVVLASDATHLYAHMEQNRAFRIVYNLPDLLEGYQKLKRLASSSDHIIPGHDPQVLARYPAASPATEGWIARLDVETR